MRTTKVLMFMLLANTALATPESQTIDILDQTRTISPAETETVLLPGWHHVQKVYIQASGNHRSSEFEVIANGDVKGTIFVPGHDPSYVVTIGETIRSLQFRHRSGGAATIYDIKAVTTVSSIPTSNEDYTVGGSCYPGIQTDCLYLDLPARNQATAIARRAIYLTERLEDFANYHEYGVYLLPIKKVAARTYSVAAARGDISRRTYEYLIALRRQIVFAKPYLDDAFERDAAFQLAVELLALGDQLDDLLDE